jgi:hypothetical protein
MCLFLSHFVNVDVNWSKFVQRTTEKEQEGQDGPYLLDPPVVSILFITVVGFHCYP